MMKGKAMEVRTAAVILVALVCAMGLLIVPAAYSHNNSAPNFECIGCHEGELSPDLVEIQGLPKKFIPGKKYILSVVITGADKSGGDVAGGFAVEASEGELIVKDKKNTQLSDRILTHTQDGSTLRKWSFIWRAPVGKAEPVISVMALAANGDYSAFGDKVGVVSYTLVSASRNK